MTIERLPPLLRNRLSGDVLDFAGWSQIATAIASKLPPPQIVTPIWDEARAKFIADVQASLSAQAVHLATGIDIPGTGLSALKEVENSVVTTQGLDALELLSRLPNAKKGLRIWTTWSPLLCRSACGVPGVPHGVIGGVFEKLYRILSDITDRTEGRVDIEILLVKPDVPPARQRSEATDKKIFEAMTRENYTNLLALLDLASRSAGSLRIRARYSLDLPLMSYYQVDHYIDMGFFKYKTDASHGTRFRFSGAQHAGENLKDLYKYAWDTRRRTVLLTDRSVARYFSRNAES